EEILSDVQRIHRDKGYVVIVMSENVRTRDGKPLGVAALQSLTEQGAVPSVESPSFVDSFGHAYYRGISPAIALSELITNQLDLRARVDVPGTLQRSSQAHQSEVDLVEAEECGRAAVRAALAGTTDQMVILERAEGPLYRATIGMAELERIANVEKHLPADFITPEGNFVTQ